MNSSFSFKISSAKRLRSILMHFSLFLRRPSVVRCCHISFSSLEKARSVFRYCGLRFVVIAFVIIEHVMHI